MGSVRRGEAGHKMKGDVMKVSEIKDSACKSSQQVSDVQKPCSEGEECLEHSELYFVSHISILPISLA